MAELGIIASGMGIASLGIQIGSGIIRLKQLWNDVKDTPEEIRYLIEEIEILGQVLAGVDDHSDISPSGRRCLDLCCRGAQLLAETLNDLETKVTKRRRIGSLKAVLGGGAVDKLRERLRSAQTMLMLATQISLHSLSDRRHEIQRELALATQQQVQNLTVLCSQPVTTTSFASSLSQVLVSNSEIDEEIDHGNKVQSQLNLQSRRKELKRDYRQINNTLAHQRTTIAQFRPPGWLSSYMRSFEIYSCKAPYGWDFSIRPYCIVPRGSKFFECASNGDIQGIQNLFQKGEARPFDRSEAGKSALHFAAFSQNVEVFRSLVEQGVELNSWFYELELVLDVSGGAVPIEDTLQILDYIWEFVETEDPLVWIRRAYIPYQSRGSILWIRKKFQALGLLQSAESIVQFAIPVLQRCRDRLVENSEDYCSVVKLILGSKQIDEVICNAVDSKGQTLLSQTLWQFGQSFIQTIDSHFENTEISVTSTPLKNNRGKLEDLVQLLTLLSDLVKGGSDLNSLSRPELGTFLTPLLWIVSGSCRDRAQDLYGIPQPALAAWVQFLEDCEVDLRVYGRKEKAIHQTPDICKNWWILEDTARFYKKRQWGCIRLINFVYGPEPRDWKFWFTKELEPWFFQFWDMIDHPERAMPGAWNDFGVCGEDSMEWMEWYTWPNDWYQ
ncbi:uncharacterized protein LY89DRAFT_685051 [Mollisia scopiformis]|uniref:Uncharacterized protein n=1 Tax=Mollisia scopiformis TaxID=149040 RepID=A0A194XBG1_MOLSC|nr:uncharacterized protein LY89DRAFT_685051 [Mollisia scopiformis]KUJ17097.1 hypothetical protein LY89DRAFT_685051 [Mollisia scopiformis]